jgi:hypothetical protein
MNSFALVVHDEETFLAKVVNHGMEQGIFTRDRADEIIRISVAMANKYVLHKDVDFRSSEELAKVQETVLKLIGIGLEMRSKGAIEEGIRVLMEVSPVDLFRLAHTRVEKLRHRWRLLLQHHRIEILVSSSEYECLSELTCQRLSEMSIFTDTEIHTIRSLTLGDELFGTLALLEYYEAELERYAFILRLREILPFGLLNRSPSVRAENLSEVDSIRHALINTLIVSGYLALEDPVAVTMADVRRFLQELDLKSQTDIFPEELENVLVDLIHELAEGLEEHEASLLAKTIIQTAQEVMDIIINEWDTVSSPSESTFFKRWSRLVILSDFPDPMDRILASHGPLDEFDYELLVDQFQRCSPEDVPKLAERTPWNRLTPSQLIQLFHDYHSYQKAFGPHVSLKGCTAQELEELLEMVQPEVMHELAPALREALAQSSFTMEDLELLAGVPHAEKGVLSELSAPPVDFDGKRALREFRDLSGRGKEILLFSCRGADFFPALFGEAWAVDAAFVKRHVKKLGNSEIGPFLLSAAGGLVPEVVQPGTKTASLRFEAPEVNGLFGSLTLAKKKAAVAYFQANPRGHD